MLKRAKPMRLRSPTSRIGSREVLVRDPSAGGVACRGCTVLWYCEALFFPCYLILSFSALLPVVKARLRDGSVTNGLVWK